MIFNTAIFSGKGGGGGGVSLDIITATSLPATVVDNQIVVITSTTPGVIYVDTDEPEVVASGDVWVKVSASEIGVNLSDTVRNGLASVSVFNGTTFNYLSAYVGHNGVWEQFSWDIPSVGTPIDSWEWEQIHRVSIAGKSSKYWSVGDTKTININDVPYVVEIVGLNHDDLADGSGKAGVTFGLKDCLDTKYAITSLKSALKSTIFNQLESDLQAFIKPVTKKTATGGMNSTINKTTETLFLFSEVEVVGSSTYSHSGEGEQYPRFTTSSARVKKVGGSAFDWWLRSPHKNNNANYAMMTSAGAASAATPSWTCGAAFAFCV